LEDQVQPGLILGALHNYSCSR